MEYKTSCGCIVVDSPPNFKIKYCSKHGAAPDLYEALKVVLGDAEIAYHTELIPSTLALIKQALTKADGK